MMTVVSLLVIPLRLLSLSLAKPHWPTPPIQCGVEGSGDVLALFLSGMGMPPSLTVLAIMLAEDSVGVPTVYLTVLLRGGSKEPTCKQCKTVLSRVFPAPLVRGPLKCLTSPGTFCRPSGTLDWYRLIRPRSPSYSREPSPLHP